MSTEDRAARCAESLRDPPRRLAARVALGLIGMLTPLLGAQRAEWVIARLYAMGYLVRFHLTAQNARALLGFAWVALTPLLLIAVYLPVFVFVFKMRIPGRESVLDYAFFCLAGLVTWAAVSDALGQGASCLVSNAAVVRNAPTPPILLPLLKVMTSFAWLAVSLLILLAVFGVSGTVGGTRLLLLPVAYALLFSFTLGLAFLSSILAAHVHDLIPVLPTLLAIEFLAAPVTYQPEPSMGVIYVLASWNPLTPFLQLVRASLLPWQPFEWRDLGLAVLLAAFTLALGVFTFRKFEGTLRDVL